MNINNNNHTKEILIVEDEMIIAMDLKMILTNIGYIVFDTIDRGDKVLQSVRESKPDLILMDIALKGKMTGIDVAEELYKLNYDIPIIYTSAEINKERLNKIKLPNTYGFLIKPLREDSIYTTLEIALDKYELELQIKNKTEELERSNEELERTNEELKINGKIIEEQKENLDNLLNSISDAFFSINNKMEVVYFNKKSEILLKKHKEEVLGKYLFNSFPEAKDSIFEEKYRYALKYKEQLTFQTYFDIEPYRDWYHVKVYPNKNGISVIFQIVTEEIEREKLLKQKNEELSIYEILIENSYDIMNIIDTEGTIIYESPAIKRILGYNIGEQIGTNVFDNVHPEDIEKVKNKFKDLMEYPGKFTISELRFKHKNGSWIYLESSGKNMLHDSNINGIIINSRDITKRKKAEDLIFKQNTQMQLAQKMARIGYWSLDIESGIPQWSEMMYEIIGWDSKKDPPTYHQHRQLIHPDDWDKFDKAVMDASNGTPYRIDLKVIFPDNSLHYVTAQGYPQKNEKGKITSLFGTTQDITKQKQIEESYKKSKENYRFLYENTSDMIILHDIDGSFLYISPAIERLLGYTPEEYKHFSPYENIYPDDINIIQDSLNKIAQGQNLVTNSYRIYSKSGKLLWIESRFKVIRDKNGKMIYLISSSSDITTRKSAENALKESEASLKSLLDNTLISFILIDKDYKIISFNKTAHNNSYNLFKHQIKTGDFILDYIIDDHKESFNINFKKALSGEIVVIDKKINNNWFTINYTPIKVEGETISKINLSMLNITDKKLAEEEIIENEKILYTVFNNNADPQILWKVSDDNTLRIEAINNAYIQLIINYGYNLSKKDFINKTLKNTFDMLGLDRTLWDNIDKHYHEVLSSKKITKYEEIIDLSNRTFYSEVTLVPILDDNNNCIYIIYNSHNITEQTIAKQKLKKYAESLKLSNKHLEDFAYNVSHDIKNYISNIISALKIISIKHKDTFAEEDLKIINIAREKASNMSQFINDLLNYSKLNSSVNPEYVNINEIFEKLENKNLYLTHNNLPTIFGTKSLITTLFTNLINNSIKYCIKSKPIIRIKSIEKDNHWLFSIEDNGIGINDKDKDDIFQMLYRADEVKDKFDGTGIGLSICKKIVELHGGEIWVESELGKGSIFYFTLEKKSIL